MAPHHGAPAHSPHASARLCASLGPRARLHEVGAAAARALRQRLARVRGDALRGDAGHQAQPHLAVQPLAVGHQLRILGPAGARGQARQQPCAPGRPGVARRRLRDGCARLLAFTRRAASVHEMWQLVRG